jgi:phage virion morphogenesis protein
MPAHLDFSLDEAALGADLAALAAKAEHLDPLMDEVGMILVGSTTRRFETGEGPDGKPWEKSARAKTEGGKTLLQDGHLRDSITYDASGRTVTVGSNRIYAAIHQFGGVIVPKNAKALAFQAGGGLVVVSKVTMPARPYLGVNDDDEAAILDAVDAHFAEAQ